MAMLLVLALGIFFLDRVLPLFHRRYTVVAVFPTAPGLRTGSPVWVAGVQVGTIRRIALLPPRDTLERVALDLQLRRSVAEQLRRDSQVRFTALQMIGEKVVELLPGSPASPELGEGDTLRVGPAPNPAHLMGQARALRLALDSLRIDAAGLRRAFAIRRQDLARAMREAGLARRELAELQAGMRAGSLAKLVAIQRHDGPMSRVRKRGAEIQRLFADAQRRAGRERQAIAPAQRSLMVHARALQAELATLRALTTQPVGTLGRMQRDSALQRAMERARVQLDSLVTESRKHPLRYVF